MLNTDFGLSSASNPVWLNEREQFKGVYPDRGMPLAVINHAESPRIKFDRRRLRGGLLDAYPMALGIWLLSGRLKALLEGLDPAPDAFAFRRVKLDYTNFKGPGPDYWFGYFMRELDCVDEAQSIIGYQEGISWKNYLHLIDIRMRAEAVGAAHAFRLKYSTLTSIVDETIVDALKGDGIRGFEFRPIQKPTWGEAP